MSVPRNPLGNLRMINELRWFSGVAPTGALVGAAIVDFQSLDCGTLMFQVKSNRLRLSREECGENPNGHFSVCLPRCVKMDRINAAVVAVMMLVLGHHKG